MLLLCYYKLTGIRRYCTISINSSGGVTCDQVDEVLAPTGWRVTCDQPEISTNHLKVANTPHSGVSNM